VDPDTTGTIVDVAAPVDTGSAPAGPATSGPTGSGDADGTTGPLVNVDTPVEGPATSGNPEGSGTTGTIVNVAAPVETGSAPTSATTGGGGGSAPLVNVTSPAQGLAGSVVPTA
jgi:hypothetical protein